MSVADYVERARYIHEQFFTDHIVVEIPADVSRDELETETVTWEPVYAGPGLVQAQAAQSRQVDSAGVSVVVGSHVCKLPARVALQDWEHARVRVTQSLDADNLGVYDVLWDGTQGWATARRLICTRSQP